MSKQRLSVTERVRNEIDELFADRDCELGEALEEVEEGSPSWAWQLMHSPLEAVRPVGSSP